MISVLTNPHPPVSSLDASRFDYAGDSFRHILGRLDDDGVLTVTLNRPEKMNTFTNEMCHDLVFAFELADADPRVKAVVLTGAGRMFCAGADLSGGFGDDSDIPMSHHRDGGGQVALAVYRCMKPVIAAMNGNAVGVGVTMTLPADIRIVAKEAKLALPFVKRGIAMEAASSYFLPRLVGHSNALELTLTGDIYTPEAPAIRGLFSRVVPAAEVLPQAMELARRMARENSSVSMALNKGMIWRVGDSPEAAHLVDSQAIAFTSPRDGKEGVMAFLQKRPVKFQSSVRDLERSGFWPFWKAPEINGPRTRGVGSSKL